MTASGDFIRGGRGGAARCGVPLQTNSVEKGQTPSLLPPPASPLCFSNWLAAVIFGNFCLSITRWKKKKKKKVMFIADRVIGPSSQQTAHATEAYLRACARASTPVPAAPSPHPARTLPAPRSQLPCLLSHYIDCGRITVSKFTTLTKEPRPPFFDVLIQQAGARGAPFHVSNVRWCYLRVASNPQTRSLFHCG